MEYRSKKLFINLPVKDLEVSMDFFEELGFRFEADFSDEKAACLVIGDNMYAMLITPEHFGNFTKKGIADSFKGTEVILTITVDSREKVDLMVNKALEAGAKPSAPSQDFESMYWAGFEDIDGHLWEVMYAEEGNIPT